MVSLPLFLPTSLASLLSIANLSMMPLWYSRCVQASLASDVWPSLLISPSRASTKMLCVRALFPGSSHLSPSKFPPQKCRRVWLISSEGQCPSQPCKFFCPLEKFLKSNLHSQADSPLTCFLPTSLQPHPSASLGPHHSWACPFGSRHSLKGGGFTVQGYWVHKSGPRDSRTVTLLQPPPPSLCTYLKQLEGRTSVFTF